MAEASTARSSSGHNGVDGEGATGGNVSGSRSRSSRPGSSSGSKSKSDKPPVRIGQYTLQQTLGTGSFGKVKLATHSLTGHRVAMKIINRRKISSMDMGARVKREIQYLKLLRHPHIIKLYEVITTPSDIIMVIEYAGGELFQYIVDRGRMSEDEGRRFFQQIICAIEYTHRHKIVHRDLKPENLLLDEYLNVKIGDFGLSNIMTDGDFLKTSCGSPNYAAPEVISGKLYAGPEIDIWSCGVILYVMLCGRLPFDDEYIPTLFKKINGGVYSLPSYLSPEAKHLLSSMLVVDPVKRITIAEIRQLPWFKQGLPSYLQPLPPTPAAEASGFDFGGMTPGSSTPVSDDASNGAGEPIRVPEIGALDDELVDELCGKMVGFTRDDVLQDLMEPGENQVKVAYQLVRDHKRMIQTSHLEEKKEMQGFLAQSPPAWNAGLGEMMGRSTSIKRSRQDVGASSHVADTSVAYEVDQNLTLEDGTTDAEELYEYDDEPFTDDEALFTEDDDLDPSATPAQSGLAVLDTSLRRGNVGDTKDAPPPEPELPPAAPQRRPRSRWHFGIRSRSPPMEIMLELYRTLQVLGMEWKAHPERDAADASGKADKGDKADEYDERKNQELFFVETRWKVQNVIVRMNLQLYRVDAANYLVDFRNVGYVLLDESPLGGERGDIDVSSPFLFLECATRLIVELAGGS